MTPVPTPPLMPEPAPTEVRAAKSFESDLDDDPEPASIPASQNLCRHSHGTSAYVAAVSKMGDLKYGSVPGTGLESFCVRVDFGGIWYN